MGLYNNVRLFMLLETLFIGFFLLATIVRFGFTFLYFTCFLLILVILSYFPLFSYYSDAINETKELADDRWHHRYQNLILTYCWRNVILVLLFLLLEVIVLTNLDLWHVALHLSNFSKITCFILIVLLVFLVILAYGIQRHHAKRVAAGLMTKKRVTVYVNGVLDDTHYTLDELKLSSAASVIGVPLFDKTQDYDGNSTTIRAVTAAAHKSSF